MGGAGSVEGGTVVDVHASRVHDSTGLFCGFFGDTGAQVTPATRVASTLARCVTPPHSHNSMSVAVELSANGVDFTAQRAYFGYRALLSLHSAWPVLGPVSGGTFVTVTGSNFAYGSTSCRFGFGAALPADWISDTTIKCTSPAGSPGLVNLGVSTNGVDFLSTAAEDELLAFQYHRELAILKLEPSAGPLLGGTVVSITGTNLVSSPFAEPSCRFGGAGAEVVTGPIVGSELHCNSPSQQFTSSRNITISASMNGVDFVDAGDFLYVPEPELHSIYPASGPAEGGTIIQIFGANLLPISPEHNALCGIHYSDDTVATADETSIADTHDFTITMTLQELCNEPDRAHECVGPDGHIQDFQGLCATADILASYLQVACM